MSGLYARVCTRLPPCENVSILKLTVIRYLLVLYAIYSIQLPSNWTVVSDKCLRRQNNKLNLKEKQVLPQLMVVLNNITMRGRHPNIHSSVTSGAGPLTGPQPWPERGSKKSCVVTHFYGLDSLKPQ